MSELQQDLSLGEGGDLYTNRVTEDDCLFPADRDSGRVPIVPIGDDLSAQDTQPENAKSPESLTDEHEGRPNSHEPMTQGLVEVTLLLVKILYLERKGGGISSLNRQCNRVLG